ncbi:MAG: hypothetical protein WCL16_06065 [bacterium]
MATPSLEIGATGLDAGRLVREIQDAVAARLQDGDFADPRLAQAERHNLSFLQNNELFLDYYLQCLREAITVDINDFEVRERRNYLAPLLVAFKRTIWKSLKFYTYRLWSQQNQVNGLLLAATEELDRKYRDRMQVMEARLAKLEAERHREP